MLAAGARLGATTDVVPTERFEPDLGPDPDVEPLRANLANVFEGIDEYAEVVDPLLGVGVQPASVSGDLVAIAGALAQGLRHYETGGVLEALWWWQFSYLSYWGERASSAPAHPADDAGAPAAGRGGRRRRRGGVRRPPAVTPPGDARAQPQRRSTTPCSRNPTRRRAGAAAEAGYDAPQP